MVAPAIVRDNIGELNPLPKGEGFRFILLLHLPKSERFWPALRLFLRLGEGWGEG